jgi:hypothetical protein
MAYNFTPGSVLYEASNTEACTHTRVVVDHETGLPLIIKRQNTRPIVEANKRRANAVDRHQQRRRRLKGAGTTQIASIPIVVWHRLVALGIHRDEKALLKWLSERDNRAFRVDDGRKLA